MLIFPSMGISQNNENCAFQVIAEEGAPIYSLLEEKGLPLEVVPFGTIICVERRGGFPRLYYGEGNSYDQKFYKVVYKQKTGFIMNGYLRDKSQCDTTFASLDDYVIVNSGAKSGINFNQCYNAYVLYFEAEKQKSGLKPVYPGYPYRYYSDEAIEMKLYHSRGMHDELNIRAKAGGPAFLIGTKKPIDSLEKVHGFFFPTPDNQNQNHPAGLFIYPYHAREYVQELPINSLKILVMKRFSPITISALPDIIWVKLTSSF